MKIVLENELFGRVVWEVPQDLASTIDGPEKALAGLLEEAAFGHQFSKHIAGKAKGAIIDIIQTQIASFFTLLTKAHRQAKTATPPSRYSRIVEEGLVWTAAEIEKAASQ
jgi:hypothetical protein